MASDHKEGEPGEALATDLRFSFDLALKSFRAKIITILFANVELHREEEGGKELVI